MLASLSIIATACTTMPGPLGNGASAPRGLPSTASVTAPGTARFGVPDIASSPPAAAEAALARAKAAQRRETVETGIASWYGPGFAGRPTASGEIFDPAAMTAAHPELPLGSEVVVVNLQNGREAMLTINDRGPFIGDRVIDVSRAAARALGFYYDGLAEVRVELIAPEPRAGLGSEDT
jgi:rare lipoprotein A